MLDNEVTRFWTRFNIFIAIQIGAFVGILNQAELLLLNQWIFHSVFLFLASFSLFNVFVVYRGYDLQCSLVASLDEIEGKITERTGKPMLMIKENMKIRPHAGAKALAFFSALTLLFWLVFWWYLSNCNGCIVLPAK